MNRSSWLGDCWQDFRYGSRVLGRNPGFLAIATLSLALGIGANTAIFQLLDAVRLRLLPVAHPEQLAELQIAKNEHCCSGNFSDRHPNLTYPQWEQIRNHQQAFSGIFAWGDQRFNLAEGGEARNAEGLWVSGDFFRTLGVQPLVGRLIAAEDDRPGCGGAKARPRVAEDSQIVFVIPAKAVIQHFIQQICPKLDSRWSLFSGRASRGTGDGNDNQFFAPNTGIAGGLGA